MAKKKGTLAAYLKKIQSSIIYYEEDCLKNPSENCKHIFAENLKWTEGRAKFPKGGAINQSSLSQALKKDGKFIKENKVFIADVDKSVVGGIFASIDKEISIGYIWGLFIEQEFRKFELANVLLFKAKKWLKSKGVSEIEMVVKGGNEGALAFYMGQGFKMKSYLLRLNQSKYSDKTHTTPHNRFK